MNPPDQPTQPTEAHRKLVAAITNHDHEVAEVLTREEAAQLIADSEARAVAEATAQLRSELNYAKASEKLYHDEGTAAIADLTAECEKVRVLREALESLAYWSRNKTESRITLRNRIAAALAATEEKP